MSSIHDVMQFQRKFGIPENREPGFLPDSRMAERLNFLLEELKELANACGYFLDDGKDGALDIKFKKFSNHQSAEDLEKAIDGLVDLVYVALGTAAQMGLGGLTPVNARGRSPIIWWEAWRRVHAANMQKVRVTDVSQSKRGSPYDCVKPPGWVAPTFGDLLGPKIPTR
jgi:predicted HAD superfamily Cof-like phosphohydrolase